MCVCHCVAWIITVCSLGPRLSLNGQSQLKLGYRRPRAEQPGHQESKIKQRPLLPPKIDHHRQAETRLPLRKNFPRILSELVSCAPPPDLQDHVSPQIKGRARRVISNLTEGTKEGRFRGRRFDPRGQNQWHYYHREQQDYIQSAQICEVKVLEESSFLQLTLTQWRFQSSIEEWTGRHVETAPEGRSRRTERGSRRLFACIQTHQRKQDFNHNWTLCGIFLYLHIWSLIQKR